MRIRLNASFLVLAIVLAGCAPFAPRTAIPEVRIGDDLPAADKYPAPTKIALPHETDIRYIEQQMRAYVSTWTDARFQLLDASFALNEGIFYGSLGAAIGGLTHSHQLALAGAGVAGGSSIFLEHYGFKVQASNYGTAADAMQCLDNRVVEVAQAFWDLYDSNGMLKVGREYFANDAPALNGYDKLADLIPTINDNINKVVTTLQRAQMDVKFVSPSVADITKAVSESVEAKGTATSQGASVTKKLELLAGAQSADQYREQTDVVVSTARFPAAKEAAVRAVLQPGLASSVTRALQLPTDMDTCLAALGK